MCAAGQLSHTWSFARSPYVYGFRTNDRGETVVVRSRMALKGG